VVPGAMAEAHPMCGFRAAASSSPVVAVVAVVAVAAPTVAAMVAWAGLVPGSFWAVVALLGPESRASVVVSPLVAAAKVVLAALVAAGLGRVNRPLRQPVANLLRPIRARVAVPPAPPLRARAVR
jgi:hypothetical protein